MLKIRQALEQHPILMGGIITSLQLGLGEIINTNIIKQEDFSTKRLSVVMAVGLILGGPILSPWYRTMPTLLNIHNPSRRALVATLLDQTVVPPVFISVYFSSVALVNGLSHQEILHRLSQVIVIYLFEKIIIIIIILYNMCNINKEETPASTKQ